jgi:alpha-tubulin suppressor-like RCC1 family protein
VADKGVLYISLFLDKTTAHFEKLSPLLSNVLTYSVGQLHMIALLENGEVWACGRNGKGELGTGTLICSATPVRVPLLYHHSNKSAKVVMISAGSGHNLVLLDDSTVLGWGWNRASQLGELEIRFVTPPCKLPNLEGHHIISVHACNTFSLALTGMLIAQTM